jgi:hypothetical protein
MKFSCCICAIDFSALAGESIPVPPPRELNESNMKNYNSSTPRVASGLAAMAMVAVTMGVLVVLPAKFDALSEDPLYACGRKGGYNGANGVAVDPARVDGPAIDGAEHAATECRDVGAQASRGKPHKLSSRSQSNT